jgi:DNA-binding XRE family transcriptional regulator
MGKPTKLDITGRALSIDQQNAVDLLVVGKTDQATAEAVGVSRQTVNGWRNGNPWFQAEVNRRRQELWGVAVDQLRALLPRAVAVLAEELETGEARARVAVDILRLAGLDRIKAPQKLDTFLVGLTDPDAIIDAEVRRRRPDMDVYFRDIRDGHGAITEAERQAVLTDWSVL